VIELAGFVDAHVHLATEGAALGVLIEDLRLQGVVAAVDAGTCGAVGYDAAARDWRGLMTVRAFANVVPTGLRGEKADWGEPPDDPLAALRGVRPDGVKLRLGESPQRDDLTDLLNARQAAIALGVPLMVHATNARLAPEHLLDALRPGDVLTHCFTRTRGAGTFALLDEDGTVRRAARTAQERGVAFDVGASLRHFDAEVARRAIAQGFFPDFISSDATSWAFVRRLVPDAPEPLTLAAVARILIEGGLPFERAVAATTIAPAAFFGFTLGAASADDHVALDEAFRVHRVVRGGSVLYQAN
jgi:dihydroorotase